MAELEKKNGVPEPGKRISTAEAARMLAVTKQAIRYMVARGELVPIVAGGKHAWFDCGDVIALAAKRAKRRPGRLTQGAVEAAAMVAFDRHAARGTLARCVPDVMIVTLLPATEVQRLRAIFAHERGIAIPAPAPMPPEEREAREARVSDDAQATFEREMAARQREHDRDMDRADENDDDDEKEKTRRKRR